MKKVCATLLVLAIITLGAGADQESAAETSFGFLLNEYVDDFGLGAQITSPFLFDILAFRVTGTVQFSRINDWAPWGTLQAGILGGSKLVSGFARFYGEGGAILAFPDSGLSTAQTAWGGYGHFGFEFFTGIDSPIAYFLEVGATGSGLRADKQSGSLILNGLRIQVGFRGYPFKRR